MPSQLLAPAFIKPDWPAPPSVKALTTVRSGGVSQAPYDSLNLGGHVGDAPEAVQKNRDRLIELAQLPATPRWLAQHHSIDVLDSRDWQLNIPADGLYSTQPNHVCVALTADCLPVLICDCAGQQVAAVHAGWRGLANGIVEQAIAKFHGPPADLLVWLGPAIGPQHFEVGPDVLAAFETGHPNAVQGFRPVAGDRFMADIYLLARQRLAAIGIDAVYGGGDCTMADAERFFSFRRDDVTGRMASLIWIAADS